MSSPESDERTKSSDDLTKLTNQSAMIDMGEPLGELDGAINRLATNTRLSLKNYTVKQMYQHLWERMQSWGSFIDTQRMKVPSTSLQWTRRVIANIEHFQSNYLCIFLILVVYCILTSPLLLLAIGASLGACYIIMLKNAESPLKVFGYKLSLAHQYMFVATFSFPLFYLAGAGSAVFWVLGASMFVIGLHASIFAIEQEPVKEENPFQFTSANRVQDV